MSKLILINIIILASCSTQGNKRVNFLEPDKANLIELYDDNYFGSLYFSDVQYFYKQYQDSLFYFYLDDQVRTETWVVTSSNYSFTGLKSIIKGLPFECEVSYLDELEANIVDRETGNKYNIYLKNDTDSLVFYPNNEATVRKRSRCLRSVAVISYVYPVLPASPSISQP